MDGDAEDLRLGSKILGMHHQIDSLAYRNRLRYLPPEHKLLFAIALFTLGFLTSPAIQGAIALWLALWVIGYARIPADVYLKLQAIPLTMGLMSLPALLLGISRLPTPGSANPDALLGVALGRWYLYLSDQGLQQGGALIVRAIALTSCLYFILLTVPFTEILQVLKRLGCPVLITDLLALMYRFIFVLVNTVSELTTAQQARLGYTTWHNRMRSLSIVVSQLLWRTLDNYQQISLGLRSRGYGHELRVGGRSRHKPSLRYTLEAIAGLSILLTLSLRL